MKICLFVLPLAIFSMGSAVEMSATESPATEALATESPATETPTAEAPDIRSIEADLQVPALTEREPAAGKRVKQTIQGWQQTQVYHVLYLPEDWQAGAKYPVIVEWAGNGYKGQFGDVSTGRPEGSNLGYGLSGGRGFIWLCLPYLNEAGDDIVLQWWGDSPKYDPQPTLRYCRQAVADVCRDFGGDSSKVVLCGFSRGAIGCNYLGLHDDQTAKLWCGFFVYSHYDGMRSWPYPGCDKDSAIERLQRLGDRPQFICQEGDSIEKVREYLEPLAPRGNLTFAKTGFRNHNDAWILRPSDARIAARNWLDELMQR